MKAIKYIFWPEHGVEQLFDLRSDPREQNDLAGQPGYADRLDRMRTRFERLKETAQ